MQIDKPYFLSNKEWFYYDEEEYAYKIKDNAPAKAKESYKEYMDQLEKDLD